MRVRTPSTPQHEHRREAADDHAVDLLRQLLQVVGVRVQRRLDARRDECLHEEAHGERRTGGCFKDSCVRESSFPISPSNWTKRRCDGRGQRPVRSDRRRRQLGPQAKQGRPRKVARLPRRLESCPESPRSQRLRKDLLRTSSSAGERRPDATEAVSSTLTWCTMLPSSNGSGHPPSKRWIGVRFPVGAQNLS